MQKLNLPEYKFKIKKKESNLEIYDSFRKAYFVLTPEEWVRQNFLKYLTQEKKYPASLIAVEKSLKYNLLLKRADIILFNNLGKPIMIVECKAPEIKITQEVFDQIARYNMALMVRYLVVTNGLNHFVCEMNYEKNSITYLKDIPSYEFQNQ